MRVRDVAAAFDASSYGWTRYRYGAGWFWSDVDDAGTTTMISVVLSRSTLCVTVDVDVDVDSRHVEWDTEWSADQPESIVLRAIQIARGFERELGIWDTI